MPAVPTLVRDAVVPEKDIPFVPIKFTFPTCPLIMETGAAGLRSSCQSDALAGVVVERM
jgi:hypothetical protein